MRAYAATLVAAGIPSVRLQMYAGPTARSSAPHWVSSVRTVTVSTDSERSDNPAIAS